MTNFTGLATLSALLIGSAELCCAARAGQPAAFVEFESPLASAQPLQGYLRTPDGPGPSPAVVLLHGCSGFFKQLDERWGKRLAAWGYVTLTVDRFGPRGITSACTSGAPAATVHDAYRALSYLARQSAVDPDRVAVVGFSQGAWLALLSVERGAIEHNAAEKFRAAVAFYPPCLSIKGDMTVPTLIMVGELDDWTPAKECRTLAEGRDDYGISRQNRAGHPIELIVYPGAYHGFDVQHYSTPVQMLGHHLEFNEVARDQSIDALRKFLYATIGGQERSQ
ncbi:MULTISPECIES: dienelactone hydrolase family protein [Bradyrhizobium]|jgi:dienelactone hydrolase|uniref:dienelactone hydrolase family protein n=1 Tax=Bradyrhizobium TaxID=374 RepID=UPI00048925BF|nr:MULTISPECIES: dienelactone hydrolase family protein [Bradyrhizobium]MCS3452864.1 dienelactone hydrolase [Bradyrhizobium elkanii]MCS3565032.1 dienelactone hydrolase [Bradyrhizobium elkanii]MCW2145140.1 dienelactone hydrolase [Bradyrhizobium elkanii]MCW2356043.1 dienelactone hydrolase [Bradyrhizobium elkanii]MCW2377966.1 dienelactone hydrolase [Bradyrhizobium elkanii]